MSDTASTTITADWALSPTSTKLGHDNAHSWQVTNAYSAPVYLLVPPFIFTETMPADGFLIAKNGGSKLLELLPKPERSTGNLQYTVSVKSHSGGGPGDLAGNLDVKK